MSHIFRVPIVNNYDELIRGCEEDNVSKVLEFINNSKNKIDYEYVIKIACKNKSINVLKTILSIPSNLIGVNWEDIVYTSFLNYSQDVFKLIINTCSSHIGGSLLFAMYWALNISSRVGNISIAKYIIKEINNYKFIHDGTFKYNSCFVTACKEKHIEFIKLFLNERVTNWDICLDPDIISSYTQKEFEDIIDIINNKDFSYKEIILADRIKYIKNKDVNLHNSSNEFLKHILNNYHIVKI